MPQKDDPAAADQKIDRYDGSCAAHSMPVMKLPQLHTDRLVLRRWTAVDRETFAQINADPEVMRYRSRTLTRQESDELLDTFEVSFEEHGFGQWGLERAEDHQLLGFTGLELASEDMPFRPLVHIGWHLAFDAWHHGYATEGAQAVLLFAFDIVGLSEVVAHTTASNERSRAVMRRLGMTHDPADDFDGPWYPAGHPNRRFVLYRVTEGGWRTTGSCRRPSALSDIPSSLRSGPDR